MVITIHTLSTQCLKFKMTSFTTERWILILWSRFCWYKLDLHTPTLSADFWNSPSKLATKPKSRVNAMTFPILKNLWTDIPVNCLQSPILAWNLLGNFKDFASADEMSVCKPGYTVRPRKISTLSFKRYSSSNFCPILKIFAQWVWEFFRLSKNIIFHKKASQNKRKSKIKATIQFSGCLIIN